MSPKLAKRKVVEPTWLHAPDYVLTFGPEVVDVCTAAGFEPYPEQALALDLIFAVDSAGRSAAFEVDVIAPRQQLKTGLIVQAKIGWLYVTDQRLVVYSAHDGKAVGEAFRKTTEVITGAPVLSRRLRPGRSNGILSGKGEESIELRTGQRVLYMVRTPDNGRSLTGNKIVIDEGFAYTAEQAGALLPTLASVIDPQVLVASSAGKANSEQLRDARNRGRAGTDERQAYLEWGDSDAGRGCGEGDACDHAKTAVGCALDDEERWARILPRLDRGRLETMRALRKSMPPKEFAREFMVWWDDPGVASTLVLPRWPDLELDESHVAAPFAGLVLGVAVAVNQEWASIAAGSRWPDGRIHLGAVDRRRGTRWLTDRLKDIQDRRSCAVVIDEKNPDAGLIERLEEAGVEVEVATLEDVLRSTSWLITAVEEGEVTHFGHPELDAAVRGAVKRNVGDRAAWGRRKSEADVSMLEAATLAGDGVDQGLTAGAFNIY